ncbi:ArsR/SmtB family transcription factor [Fictibacillus terranigra]|uniref:Helix-turn-helix domain-containing protein n=1 Tax=Fictibacillus terranigra TaxID=3058424 RepID=A0ABT8EBU5_9BACL|nr:helix-turn-helix domain-containing protein [Fictibacillus sp. CENA-BCM004]MDN4075391.1 helix-turn-helix domain-containing protein [Fictibacillus sp. CENA-BCM004]
MRVLHLTLEKALAVNKALGNQQRMEMLSVLTEGPKNVNDLAERLGIPFSTAAVNIKKLEDAGLITTEIVPGRGSQKVSSKRYDRIVIDLEDKKPEPEKFITLEMPIGHYVHCEVEPTCGLASERSIISILDDQRSFFEPERKEAQLIWFKSGFLEYHFPNRVPYGSKVDEISLSVELCSEAPYHKLDWPSDITCWLNGIEIGSWTSPSDFGGERGFLTPSWWEDHNTQYGMLKHWKVNDEGSYIDSMKISEHTVQTLRLEGRPYISAKFGVKRDADKVGGMNLFGSKFGNYEQDLLMKIKYS